MVRRPRSPESDPRLEPEPLPTRAARQRRHRRRRSGASAARGGRRRQAQAAARLRPLPAGAGSLPAGRDPPRLHFAAFAPDGLTVALATSRGIEVLNRADGSRVLVTPPGFTLAAGAWHPDGNTLLASGPAGDGSGPYLHTITAAGLTRLLPDHPGPARAAFFSPDGRKVAFTYLNRYLHVVCMADWTGSALADPRNLLPVDAGQRARSRAGDGRARLVRDARLQPRRQAPLLRVRSRCRHDQREHPHARPPDPRALAA